jgi:hypothetical protein
MVDIVFLEGRKCHHERVAEIFGVAEDPPLFPGLIMEMYHIYVMPYGDAMRALPAVEGQALEMVSGPLKVCSALHRYLFVP